MCCAAQGRDVGRGGGYAWKARGGARAPGAWASPASYDYPAWRVLSGVGEAEGCRQGPPAAALTGIRVLVFLLFGLFGLSGIECARSHV